MYNNNVRKDDKHMKDINIESLYMHLNFIIECPPVQKYIDSWNEKMENVVFVKEDGTSDVTVTKWTYNGVRPACWIEL